QVGKHAQAEKCYRRCREVAEEVIGHKGWEKFAAPFRPAEAANKVALALMAQGKTDDALKALEEAENLIAPHLKDKAPSLVYETLAQCLINRGFLLRGRDPKKAEEALRRALKVLDDAPKRDGQVDPRVPLQRARALTNLGGLVRARSKPNSVAYFEEALKFLE